MSTTHNVHTEIAESILEHAEAITRLDADGMGEAAYDDAVASHVSAMRLLAVPHMDPQPDRELVRKLRSLSGNIPGVYVQLADGSIQLIVDTAIRQHKIRLWNRQQFLKNEEEDEFDGG
ncbi:MAG TPA: hypothetical protein VIK70_08095 [Lysobacter sp.]